MKTLLKKATNMKKFMAEKYHKFEARERHFNFVFWVVTLTIIGYLIMGNKVDFDAVVSMTAGITFNVALLLVIGFGLQKFQLGTKRDIQKEIFDDNNIAAAIYQLGLWIALAIVISKGLM